jgi:hypothetical protein
MMCQDLSDSLHKGTVYSELSNAILRDEEVLNCQAGMALMTADVFEITSLTK